MAAEWTKCGTCGLTYCLEDGHNCKADTSACHGELTEREKRLMGQAYEVGKMSEPHYHFNAWLSDSAGDGITVEVVLARQAPSTNPQQRDISPNLLRARQNDPIVAAVLNAGGDSTGCVIALLHQKAELMKRLMLLESIAPRKMTVGDQTIIWRCPDSMVPDR